MNPIIKDLGKVIPTAEEVYDSTKEYDTLSFVSNESKTKLYLSKQVVPAGTPLEDNEYWGCLVDFDGQIIEYKELLDEFKELIDHFEDIIDDIYARCYTFIDSEERNMNNLLTPGIYKYCTLGRPPLSADKEFYTLETLDGGVIKETDEASLRHLHNLYSEWVYRQNSPAPWQEPDTAPSAIITPTIYDDPYLEINNCFAYIADRDWDDQGPAQRLEDNWCYLSGNYARQHYSIVTDAQRVTRFKRELPAGEYTIYMTIYPSSTGVRDRLAIPTQLPTIVAQCVGGGGGTFNPSGSYTVNDLIRTEVESISPNYVVSFRIVHRGGELTIFIENQTPGYNWFVFTARVAPVEYTFNNVYNIIPQKCISHKSGVIHSRTLYSSDKTKPFAPFTFYPKYASFDKDLNKVMSYWNLVVPGELFLSILGIGEESQGVIDKFNEVKEFLQNISADTKLIDLLHDVTPIKYSGNVAKQNAVHETVNNTNVMSAYAQNSAIFGESNEILARDADNHNYYPEDVLVEGTENKSDAKSSHVEGKLNSAVWDVNGAMRRANYEEALITKYNLTDDSDYGADCAHAEGYRNVASGWISHAEGNKNVAAGRNSHAEGHGTLAAGSTSHAEGRNTIAKGSYSHAQGNSTEANGASSFTAGKGTIATNEAETALGKYNKPNHLFSVGIGTDENHRKNAIEVDPDGSIGFYHPETDGLICFSDIVSHMLTDVAFIQSNGSLICQLGKGDNTTANKTVPVATTANDGVMSRTDKRNLDDIVSKLNSLVGGIRDSLAGYKVECTPANPLVFKGTNANTQTFNVHYGNPLSIQINNVSAYSGTTTLTVQTGNPCAISTSLALTDDVIISGTVKVRDIFIVPFSSTIKVVDKIRYGFTSNPTIFIGGGGLVKPATTEYKGTYSDTATANAQLFFILLPTTIVNEDITQTCQFTMGGAPVAMVKDGIITIDGVAYNVYRTAANYTSGTTLKITIS